MKSKIFLCLLLIMTMLTFGACGDSTPDAVTPDNDNDTVQEDVNDAVDDAQDEANDLDGKDTTQRDNANDVPDTDKTVE